MDHKLAVVVQVDLDARYVHLVVTGRLTEGNQRALTPLIGRARALLPGATVTVDLTSARRVDPAGLDLLQWSVHHEHAPEAAGPLLVLTRPVPFGFPNAAGGPASWGGGDLDGVAA